MDKYFIMFLALTAAGASHARDNKSPAANKSYSLNATSSLTYEKFPDGSWKSRSVTATLFDGDPIIKCTSTKTVHATMMDWGAVDDEPTYGVELLCEGLKPAQTPQPIFQIKQALGSYEWPDIKVEEDYLGLYTLETRMHGRIIDVKKWFNRDSGKFLMILSNITVKSDSGFKTSAMRPIQISGHNGTRRYIGVTVDGNNLDLSYSDGDKVIQKVRLSGVDKAGDFALTGPSVRSYPDSDNPFTFILNTLQANQPAEIYYDGFALEIELLGQKGVLPFSRDRIQMQKAALPQGVKISAVRP